jgi:hypothetical protein
MGDVRVLVYCPDRNLEQWIDSELETEPVIIQVSITIREVVRALIVDPPPRAQLLVADFACMTAIDALDLHQLRERGWFGAIIGVGEVSTDLRKSLRIDRVVRPRVRSALRNAVSAIGLHRPTTPLHRISG